MDWEMLNMSKKELIHKLGLDVSVFENLMDRYMERGRLYHNLNHITDCLRHYEKFKGLGEYRLGVQIAIWFHDAIYDPERSDNEIRSGELAEEVLLAHDASKIFARHVNEMIVGAVYNNIPKDKDTALLRDIDFSILGRDYKTYNRYARLVSAEFSYLNEKEFLRGRKAFLSKLLKKDIYINKEFRELYEDRAKENISGEIVKIDEYLKLL